MTRGSGHDMLPRVAFVHVPKTAGTSVREVFEKIYKDQSFHGMTTLDYQCFSNEQLSRFGFFAGHSYKADWERLPEDTIKFSVFRDPVERAVSLYQYFSKIDYKGEDVYLKEAINITRTKGILEFVHSNNPALNEQLRIGQIRQFLDQDLLREVGHRRVLSCAMEEDIWKNFQKNIGSFDYLLTKNWIDVSLARMMEDIGLTYDGGIEHLNASIINETIDEMALRRAVYDVNALDCRAYDYVSGRETLFLKRILAPTQSVAKRGAVLSSHS